MIRVFVREAEGERDESLSNMSIIELQGKLSLPNDVLPDSEEEVDRQIMEYQRQQCHESEELEHVVKAEDGFGTVDEREGRTHSAIKDPLSWSSAGRENATQEMQESETKAKNPLSLPNSVSTTTSTASRHSIPAGIESKTPTNAHSLRRRPSLPPSLSIGFIDSDPVFSNKRELRIGTTRVMGSAGTYRSPILVLRRMPPAREERKEKTDAQEERLDSSVQRSRSLSSSSSVESWELEDDPEEASCGGSSSLFCSPREESDRANVKAERGATHEKVPCETDFIPAEQKDVVQESSVDALYEKLIASSSKGDEKKETQSTGTEENHTQTMLFADWIELHPEMRLLSTHFGHAPDEEEEEERRKEKKKKKKSEKRGNMMRKEEDDAHGIQCHDNGMKGVEETHSSAPAHLSRKRERAKEVEKQDNASSLLSSMEVKDYEVVGIIEEFLRFNSKPSRVFPQRTPV